VGQNLRYPESKILLPPIHARGHHDRTVVRSHSKSPRYHALVLVSARSRIPASTSPETPDGRTIFHDDM